MSTSVVSALVKFGETLSDKNVDAKSKLRVLTTLNEVTLTLGELSESGVGRAVRKLKCEPGELGQFAKSLVAKWKNLLNKHINEESLSLHVSSTVNSDVHSEECVIKSSSNSRPSHINAVTSSNGFLEGKFDSKQNGSSITHTHNNNSDNASPNSPHLTLPSRSQSRSKHLVQASNINQVEVSQPSLVASKQKKNIRKRSSTTVVDSIDSSSGLSFIESLNSVSNVNPNRKKKKSSNVSMSNLLKSSFQHSTDFTTEILNSLNEPVMRPDVVHSTVVQPSESADDDFENGDLKFKSKKILWVPKSNRSLSSVSKLSNVDLNCETNQFEPPTLINICLDTIARNIHLVDHVGLVPYELMSRVLNQASVNDLTRIEHFNPQFVGLSDELWRKHISRDFQHIPNPNPKPNETYCQLYHRLSKEESNRLNQIIRHSAKKIEEEQKSRRVTLATEVITPRQIQRRAGRHNVISANSNNGIKLNRNGSENFSHSKIHYNSVNQTSGSSTGGGLLSKLRKQFRSGRLR